MVYLDHNATTPLALEVFDEMRPFLTDCFANPSGIYASGRAVREAVEGAREKVAGLLGCRARQVVFTSGGTEANNTAIRSALESTGRKHLVVSTVEHSAIKNPVEALERRGYGVSWVPVNEKGRLDPAAVAGAIRDDTALVTFMWANNETGVLFPVEEIGRICRERGVLFHVDAVQVPGKMPVALEDLPVDTASFSAHKINGPKGVGALYINRRTPFSPLMLGGGQESGRRGGTENVPAIIGAGVAAELAGAWVGGGGPGEVERLRDRFEGAVLSRVEGAVVNGGGADRLVNTTNIGFPPLEAEALLVLLSEWGVCASAGAACSSGSLEPSPVLLAMGVDEPVAHGSIRLSLSRYTTDDEIDYAVATLPPAIDKLRASMPAAPRTTR